MYSDRLSFVLWSKIRTLLSMLKSVDERDPAVVIKPVAGRKGEYLAYCRSGFLDATFSVYFRDTLMGALALHEFLQMIRRKYEEKKARTLLSQEEILFKKEALLDVLSG